MILKSIEKVRGEILINMLNRFSILNLTILTLLLQNLLVPLHKIPPSPANLTLREPLQGRLSCVDTDSFFPGLRISFQGDFPLSNNNIQIEENGI